MRIECDKCAAKYSIADEKVRGKTFKIRCKKCSNVIIVRDKVAGDDGGDAAEEPASSDDGGGWHVAIDGDTVGPLAEDEVRRRYDAGQIDKSTSVWREGFEDWLELGQIEAFADLPDRAGGGLMAGGAGAGMAAGAGLAAASAPADDPFASSGSDDAFAAGSGEFGRSSGGGYAAAAAPAAAARPQAAAASAPAESPRVGASSLTGQRNENSVLFSLDSLKAMASAPAASGGGGGSRPSHAGPVRSAPSTTAPASEGSGLIDIRAMGAMMDVGTGSSAGPSGASEDEMLPSFGGGALGGLSVEPLAVEPSPSAVPVAQEPRRSNAPMYILIALLTAGLIGLGVMIMLKPPAEPQIKEVVVTVPGSVEDKDSDKGAKEDEGDEKGEDKGDEKGDEKGDKDTAGDTGGETEGDATDPAGTAAKKKKKVGTSGTTGGTTGGTTTGGTTTGGTTAKTPEKDPDVDCLLDPDLPKCKGGGSGSGGSSKTPVDSSLPPKLGAAEIQSGIDGVKANAKKCGAGTTVPIKFSVKGSTGSVTSATPLEEHASTPIGKCVADAAKAAKFPKFQAEQQGFTFKFRL
jgi:predicted Zn finger-like uncharacterized protein